MRVRNSPKAPQQEFFREQRLRANRMVTPHAVTHNGQQFLIAGNGIRIPLQSADIFANNPESPLFQVVEATLRAKAVKVS
jgi:hypothetical protein